MKEEKQEKMAAEKIRTLRLPPIGGAVALAGGIGCWLWEEKRTEQINQIY